MKKVGLYFGSFNPIHLGHLIIANTTLDSTDLDEVWFVVTPMSPDKIGLGMTHHEDRLTILEKSISDNPKLHGSDIEFDMEQPNYTNKTLDRLSFTYPDYEFSVILGSDNVLGLSNWVGVEEWLGKYRLLVCQRHGYEVTKPLKEMGLLTDNYELVDIPLIGVSSTKIRNNVREGKSIKYLVHDCVINEIQDYYGTKEKD